MTSQVIFGVLWIVTIVAVWFIKQAEHKFKENEQYTGMLTRLEDWAAVAVRYAKDWGEQSNMPGGDRRIVAIQVMKDMRDKLKLDVSDKQLEMLVRAAYTVMIDELNMDYEYDRAIGYEIPTEPSDS